MNNYDLIKQVEADLEARGAEITTSVVAYKVKNGVDYYLKSMDVKFPNGRRWAITRIEEAEEEPKEPKEINGKRD